MWEDITNLLQHIKQAEKKLNARERRDAGSLSCPQSSLFINKQKKHHSTNANFFSPAVFLLKMLPLLIALQLHFPLELSWSSAGSARQSCKPPEAGRSGADLQSKDAMIQGEELES